MHSTYREGPTLSSGASQTWVLQPALKLHKLLQVELLTNSSAEELGAQVATWKPNMLYISTGTAPDLSQPTGVRTLTALSSEWGQGKLLHGIADRPSCVQELVQDLTA